jgi:F-type H+-transporting ATPase subunit b
MLNLDWATVLFEILNFLVLTALLYNYLFRPVMHNVKERAAEKKRLAQEIAREREAATRLRAELEERLAHADKEAATIIVQAQAQAQAEQEELLQETYAEAERILTRAQADAHRLQKQALAEFHDELLDTILDISGQIINRAAPPDLHDALVQQLNDRIWELGRSEMGRVETIRRSLGERMPTAYVTTARPLSPEQQRLLVRTFSALADHNVSLELTMDPALAVGLRVRLGDMVVDNSMAGQLAQLRQDVAQALRDSIPLASADGADESAAGDDGRDEQGVQGDE